LDFRGPVEVVGLNRSVFRPDGKLEAAYHKADKAIQEVVDLLQQPDVTCSNVEIFLFTIFDPRIYCQLVGIAVWYGYLGLVEVF
jgi:hypothetical protein